MEDILQDVLQINCDDLDPQAASEADKKPASKPSAVSVASAKPPAQSAAITAAVTVVAEPTTSSSAAASAIPTTATAAAAQSESVADVAIAVGQARRPSLAVVPLVGELQPLNASDASELEQFDMMIQSAGPFQHPRATAAVAAQTYATQHTHGGAVAAAAAANSFRQSQSYHHHHQVSRVFLFAFCLLLC